jgi:excisionase family DNA binding protein
MPEPIILLSQDEFEGLLSRAASLAVESLKDDLERSRTREIMTKSEVADYLRCDISKINRLMRKGLPSTPFGSVPRFYKSDIDHWLHEGVRS